MPVTKSTDDDVDDDDDYGDPIIRPTSARLDLFIASDRVDSKRNEPNNKSSHTGPSIPASSSSSSPSATFMVYLCTLNAHPCTT